MSGIDINRQKRISINLWVSRKLAQDKQAERIRRKLNVVRHPKVKTSA